MKIAVQRGFPYGVVNDLGTTFSAIRNTCNRLATSWQDKKVIDVRVSTFSELIKYGGDN